MSKRIIPNATALLARDIGEWLKRRDFTKNNYTFSYRPEGVFYVKGDQEIPEAEFKTMFPKDLFPPTILMENCDKTKNFMSNKSNF